MNQPLPLISPAMVLHFLSPPELPQSLRKVQTFWANSNYECKCGRIKTHAWYGIIIGKLN